MGMKCGLCKQAIRGDEDYVIDHYKCSADLTASFHADIDARDKRITDLEAQVRSLTAQGPSFKCAANKTADPPQDCDWPTCGCDPHADKVIEALQEAGKLTAQGPRAQTDHVQWTLDNIYTIARRELNRAPDRLRPEMWSHVSRLCEQVGCQPKGVLKDNGGSFPDPPVLPVNGET